MTPPDLRGQPLEANHGLDQGHQRQPSASRGAIRGWDQGRLHTHFPGRFLPTLVRVYWGACLPILVPVFEGAGKARWPGGHRGAVPASGQPRAWLQTVASRAPRPAPAPRQTAHPPEARQSRCFLSWENRGFEFWTQKHPGHECVTCGPILKILLVFLAPSPRTICVSSASVGALINPL